MQHFVEFRFKLCVWTVATVVQCRPGMACRINEGKWSWSMQRPKVFQMLTVGEMSPAIMSGGTKYQIGEILGHFREEYLVVVKSIIQILISSGKGGIVQLANFTDKFLILKLERYYGLFIRIKSENERLYHTVQTESMNCSNLRNVCNKEPCMVSAGRSHVWFLQ